MQNRKANNKDLSNKDNYLSLEKTSLGFAVENVIENLIKCDIVTKTQTKMFRRVAIEFIVSMLLNLFQRSAVCSILFRCASIFDPISKLPERKLQELFKSLSKYFIEMMYQFLKLTMKL